MECKMKFFLLILAFLSFSAMAGTCSSDNFTSSSANSVLTSTKYNGDHSTIYNRLAGNLDGGCVSDGTLEEGALNTSDFEVPLNAIVHGCKVTRTDAATLSIDKCMAAVNGAWVRTIGATSASFGCGGCSAEAASTQYYLYIATGSTGTTLTPLISTTAPNNDGYDGSSNRVVASFWNDSSQDIVDHIRQWKVNGFDLTKAHADLTVAGTNWTSSRAVGIYYLTYDGAHRLRINVHGTTSAATGSLSLTIDGIVFKTGPTQALAVKAASANYANGRANNSTNIMSIISGTTTTDFSIAGDVEIDAKPDWAN